MNLTSRSREAKEVEALAFEDPHNVALPQKKTHRPHRIVLNQALGVDFLHVPVESALGDRHFGAILPLLLLNLPAKSASIPAYNNRAPVLTSCRGGQA